MNKREEAKQAMRNKILKAARKVFSELGYEGGSFKQITEHCGAKRQLIGYHFVTKEALWKEAVLAVKNDFFHQLAIHLPDISGLSDREIGRQLTIAFLKASFDVPEYGKMVLREGITSSDRVEWFNQATKPEQVATSIFNDPEYAKASFTGLGNHIQAGALLYLSTMGPLMEEQEGNEIYPVNPMSDKTMERTADLMMDIVESLLAENKQA